jgi:hypothetical protein
MLYAILCYNSEEMVDSWTKEQDAAVMADIAVVNDKLARLGRLGPVVRLGSTKTARTLRKEREPFHITDGPYAETKEQILGFWIVDCDSHDEAMETAQELGKVNPGGAFEVRPLTLFLPGTSLAETASVAAPNAGGH